MLLIGIVVTVWLFTVNPLGALLCFGAFLGWDLLGMWASKKDKGSKNAAQARKVSEGHQLQHPH